jgi:hypothetical protein
MVEQIELNGFYFYNGTLYQVTKINKDKNTCSLTDYNRKESADQNYPISYFQDEKWRKALIHEIPIEHRKNILETLELW